METEISKEDRIRGGIIGLLVGDALGVPYEFHDAISIPTFEEIEFEPPAYFRRSHAKVPIGFDEERTSKSINVSAKRRIFRQ